MLTPFSASSEKYKFPAASYVVLSVGCVLSLCAPEKAFSQTQGAVENAVRQAEGLRQQAEQREKASSTAPAAEADGPPETYPGENADLGPQTLLKQKPKAKPLFELSADTMFTWTTNATGDATGKHAAITAETWSLALAPEAKDIGIGKLGWHAGYRQLFWMYDVWRIHPELNGNNFMMSSAFLSSNLSFKENWNASLGLDYNRIMNDSGVAAEPNQWRLGRLADASKWTEVYTEWNPNWSLSRNIGLGDKAGLTLGYNGGYHFTKTDPNPLTWSSDHLDSGVSLTLSLTPIEKWVIQPGVRFNYQVYTQPQNAGGHRSDRTLSPGLTVLWMPSERWSVRASFGSEFKYSSNADTPNYHKFEGSTGVSFTYKF